MLSQLIFGATHKVVYTNWKGETEERTLIPHKLFFGSTEHHPQPQWLVECTDVTRGHVRHYSLNGIRMNAKVVEFGCAPLESANDSVFDKEVIDVHDS